MLNIKDEIDLYKLILLKEEITQSYKSLKDITDNEEYERRSFDYYSKLGDLEKNVVYQRYKIFAMFSIKEGYRYGVEEISMGYIDIEKRLPVALNEIQYLIKKIEKELGNKTTDDIEEKLIENLFIHYYKKAIKENGERYLKIENDPFEEIRRIEKNKTINNIYEKTIAELG